MNNIDMRKLLAQELKSFAAARALCGVLFRRVWGRAAAAQRLIARPKRRLQPKRYGKIFQGLKIITSGFSAASMLVSSSLFWFSFQLVTLPRY